MKYPVLLTLIVVLLNSSSRFQEDDPPPNFLFIAIDDLNIYNSVLGHFPGNFLEKVYPDTGKRAELVQRLMPNLSKFGEQALTFEQAYCAAPLCGPSRTALMTGVPPHISGYYQHDQHFRGYETLEKVVTLPQYLRRKGYFTAGSGKVFHKGRSYLDRGTFSDWPDQLYSWDEWVEIHSGTGRANDAPDSFDVQERISPYWPQGDRSSKHFTRFGSTNVPVEQTNDYMTAKFTADLLMTGQASRIDIHRQERIVQLPEDQPFFLACGLFAPHLPWVVPQEFFDLFPQNEMQIDAALLAWIQQDLDDLPPYTAGRTLHTEFTLLLKNGEQLEGEEGKINAWKAAFQAYLATIAYADYNIGVLLEAINKHKKKANTVVILWSDHGYHVGDKNWEGKYTLWDAANHCNLMIYDPRQKGSSTGQRTQAIVSLQDIYPTIVELAGLQRPDHVYGNSLTPLLNVPRQSWPYTCLNTNGKDNHALRTTNYRYIRYHSGDQELYDLRSDPFEYNNLAQQKEHRSTLQQLDALLEKRLTEKPGQTQ